MTPTALGEPDGPPGIRLALALAPPLLLLGLVPAPPLPEAPSPIPVLELVQLTNGILRRMGQMIN
jgi:hypothetical protein